MKYPAIGLLLTFSTLGPCFSLAPAAMAAAQDDTVILRSPDASWAEVLAAREVRRYIYLRSGRLLPVLSDASRAGDRNAIVVGRKDRALVRGLDPQITASLDGLGSQNYWLKTLPAARTEHRQVLICGGDDAGTLYGAYRFAETLGVRFYLDGEVLPDEIIDWTLPVLDERAGPLFALRGIQPFHDFPEGPDWWNRDDYLAIIGQLPKLRMNFIGLHTYPEGGPNAEPTVWIGLAGDIGNNGQVKFSYPASYQNSLRGNWGYAAKKTSEFILGSAALFERDDFGADVMAGAIPAPVSPEASAQVFERTAEMLRDAFAFAHQLGVKSCVGTETPLTVPKLVQQQIKSQGSDPADLATVQQLYEGIFRRAAQSYPLDYYWFWTPEGWTWSGVKDEHITATTNDLFAAIAAHKAVQPPFALATCGWVLGPPQDRAMFDKILPRDIAVSCINREVGKTPVEPGFAEVRGRSKWAIPWLEDDPALTSLQLWAGRMRRDAADALRYGCDGLMGIHWRTHALRPNIAALAHAAWDQKPWIDTYQPPAPAPNPARTAGPVGGASAAFPNNPITGTDMPVLYQTVRYNLSAYHLPASNGLCRVTLKFSEPHYDSAGKRAFDVKVQGQTLITNLDIFATVGKNRALDFTFTNVTVTNGWLDIDFVPRIEFPSIAAIAVDGEAFRTRINCGGPAAADYAADAPSAEAVKQVYADTRDFYGDWASHEFGPAAGPAAAAIFTRIDCRLPTPSTWIDGPGGIQPDPRPWSDIRKEYAFVDEFAALRPQLRGPGNLDRFDYWLNTLLYFRAISEVNCAWAEYNRALAKVKAENDPESRKDLAQRLALPARRALVRLVGVLFQHLLATVTTPGELGTVANWNQHNLPGLLTKPGEELAKLLDEPLPPDASPDLNYHGPTRVILPTRRTSLVADEPFNLKVIILSEKPPRAAELFWRKLGSGRFASVPLSHVARGVYSAHLPPGLKDDFEYYLRVQPESGEPVFFPPSAPKLNQSVLVL